MAIVGNTGAGWASTSNAATYTSGAFTPAADDLLTLSVVITGNTATDWAPSDSLGGTWTKAVRALKATSADFLEIWVRDALVSATSMTVTFSHASGNATGSAARVYNTSGMTRTGSAAIQQVANADNQASGGTPAATFGAAVDTANPTIGLVGNATNPATLTPPTSWNEFGDIGYNTPATGFEGIARNSGFTGTTITWGSTSGSAFGVALLELDTSAAPLVLPPKPLHLLQAVNRAYTY